MIIYNAHAHLFTSNYVPDYVVGQDKIPFLKGALRISNLAKMPSGVLNTLHFLTRPFKSANRVITFAKIGLGATQEDTLNKMEDYYKGWGQLRIVVLTMDMENMGAGAVKSNYWTQLRELIELRDKGDYKNTLLPFFCVDPRRPDFSNGQVLLSMVKPYFEKHGFTGIKLYPALGYYPFDEKLFPLYAWCEENEVPIMTHCIEGVIYYRGSLQLLPSVPDTVSAMIKMDNSSTKNAVFQRNFTQPASYRPVLEKFPQLKICFAHFGGLPEMKKSDGWTQQIRNLMQTYKNVYTDTSYIIENKETFDILLNDMKDPIVGKRILFGTDYFVVSKNKLEDRLAGDFREYIINRGCAELFEQISASNSNNYLRSKYYRI